MEHLGYSFYLTDPDLWMRASKLGDGTDYNEHILLYVDDCLVISQYPNESLHRLGKYFSLKSESIGPPKLYLGGKLSHLELPNGVHTWTISASKYIQQALTKNLEGILQKHGLKLRHNTNLPYQVTTVLNVMSLLSIMSSNCSLI